ncbi:helix-turn-helix transcriptional regulator [Ascidiaceihabitans sp.]|uniref:helix-turn-helix domain-containing protein n=1 Tax=Ascidiaceihabitans sp. TaxID=1872644 RepID=UPI003296C3E1
MTENPIARRIQIILDQKNISRRSLAMEAGVSYDRLNGLFKRPQAKLNGGDLIKISRFLETTPEYLNDGGDFPNERDALRREAGRQLDLLTEAELRALLAGIRLTTADRQ